MWPPQFGEHNLRKSTVLITGGGGFLGSVIAKNLQRQCRVVVCASRPPTGIRLHDPDRHYFRFPEARFGKLVASLQPDWVIHCAGSASVGASIADPRADYINNVVVTKSIYQELARFCPATQVIFLSSAAVYGQPHSLPITLETPARPISPYGHHKRECELLGERYENTEGLRVTNLRIFSAYGPGLTKQVMWDIFQKSRDGQVQLHGTGRETRDFVFAPDVAKVVAQIIAAGECDHSYLNIATGMSVEIQTLASMLLASVGRRCPLSFTGKASAGSPVEWRVKVDELRPYGLDDFTPLPNGLITYGSWLSNQQGGSDANRTLVSAG